MTLLQDFLPVIPERSIFTRKKKQIREYLQNSEKFSQIIIILDGDATSVKLIPKFGQ